MPAASAKARKAEGKGGGAREERTDEERAGDQPQPAGVRRSARASVKASHAILTTEERRQALRWKPSPRTSPYPKRGAAPRAASAGTRVAAAVEVTYKYTSQQKQSGKWVVQIPLSDGSLLGDRAKYSTSAEAARAADALLVARKPSGELKHDVFDAEASRAGPVLRPLNFPLEQAEALVRLDREGICDIGEQNRTELERAGHSLSKRRKNAGTESVAVGAPTPTGGEGGSGGAPPGDAGGRDPENSSSSEDEEEPGPAGQKEEPQRGQESWLGSLSKSRLRLSDVGIVWHTAEEVRALVEETGIENVVMEREQEALEEARGQFGSWAADLVLGRSVLLIGVGSKRLVLRTFAEEMLRRDKLAGIVQFFGHNPRDRLPHIMRVVGEQLLNGTPRQVPDYAALRAEDLAARLTEQFEIESPCARVLYVLIHGLDGPVLNAEEDQEPLSFLTTAPSFRLAASVDTVLFPVMWTRSICERFWWGPRYVHTHAPCAEETAHVRRRGTGAAARRAAGAAAGAGEGSGEEEEEEEGAGDVARPELSMDELRSILRAATRSTLVLLAEACSMAQVTGGRVPASELFRRCEHAFVATNQRSVQDHLKELLDHGWLTYSTAATGEPIYSFNINEAKIREMMGVITDIAFVKT